LKKLLTIFGNGCIIKRNNEYSSISTGNDGLEMKGKYSMFSWVCVFTLITFVGCASLGDLFLNDQQKQWKAEGRNVKTGLFDEPYSGKSFQGKADLEAFKATAEYQTATANYTA
jgi:hypothetical protein